MTHPPDFDELVGGDDAPEELERLRRVHDLLVQAGPPPELSPALDQPPAVGAKVLPFRTRRPATAFGIAVAAAAVALVIGVVVGTRKNDFTANVTVQMQGVGALRQAGASIDLGKRDPRGNYPMKMKVWGLRPPADGGWYVLYLSKRGKPLWPCGTFTTVGTGQTTVRLSVGYQLDRLWADRTYDGWVVEEKVPGDGTPRLVLRTTSA